MRAFLIITQLLLFFNAQAQQNNITSVTASYDPACIAELYNHIPIGLEFKYANGQVRKTEGYLDGAYRWKSIKVTSSAGSVQNGYLQLDRQRAAKLHYQVELTVTLPDSPQPLTTTLTLPHLESIRFNHYADSLKRGIRFYLNVEGSFSSGKIYPLDTAAIKFTASEGKLLGQDLLLPPNDATRIITVTAINKNDPSMSVSSTIPVKQLQDK
ncbi:hypothetical protein [Chitinophaga ginsengisoli]|uniref:hypothetical protein n=1 Tax=Chitinophaga ginsengisoli TaxID=363837 RepID=UPI0011B1D895|nr:hypothetical protein [Chitinophaga ginsengisoli]